MWLLYEEEQIKANSDPPRPSSGTDLNSGFKDKNWTKGQAVRILNQSGPRFGPINPRLSLASAWELEALSRRSRGLAVSIRVQPLHQTVASSECPAPTQEKETDGDARLLF